MVFPAAWCESWTVKKAEHQKIDAFLNYGVGEDSWESLGLQGDPTSPSYSRSVLGSHWKDWCWSWNSSTLATSCEELTHWKRPWCWEGLGAGREGDDRGWDGWKASVTRWTCVWVNSGSWWWTGRPGVLRFMGSQRVRCHWTELNWWSCPDLLDSLSASPLLFFLKQTLKIRVGDSSINIGSQSQKVEIKVAWGLWPCNLHGYTHIDKCAFPNICT